MLKYTCSITESMMGVVNTPANAEICIDLHVIKSQY